MAIYLGPAPPASSSRARLIALIGTTATAAVLGLTQRWEGTRYVGYRDIVGVVTKCTGDTEGAVLGRRYTVAECEASDAVAILKHAGPVLRCTPGLKGRPHQLAAAISLTYNIGPTAYCGSTIARRFNAGDLRGGCNGFPAWNRAGGRVVRGLVSRRADERAECLKGLS